MRSVLRKNKFIFDTVWFFRRLAGITPEKLNENYYRKRSPKIIQDYFAKQAIKKLHIGAQHQHLEGWLNVDIEPYGDRGVFMDATQTFPFDNNSFDYVFSEHMIEHISFDEGVFMVKECYRILKTGGTIRISTPDLNFLIDLYQSQENKLYQEYMQFSQERHFAQRPALRSVLINNFVRDWGHQFIYDYESLEFVLTKAGFQEITLQQVGESQDSHLNQLERHGYEIGETYNRLESIIVEAKKII